LEFRAGFRAIFLNTGVKTCFHAVQKPIAEEVYRRGVCRKKSQKDAEIAIGVILSDLNKNEEFIVYDMRRFYG